MRQEHFYARARRCMYLVVFRDLCALGHSRARFELDSTHTVCNMSTGRQYAGGGEIIDHIAKMERLPEVEARKYFREIISALGMCGWFCAMYWHTFLPALQD